MTSKDKLRVRPDRDVPLPVGFTLHVVPAPLVPLNLSTLTLILPFSTSMRAPRACRPLMCRLTGLEPIAQLVDPQNVPSLSQVARELVVGDEHDG